jgi:hypothetical protein
MITFATKKPKVVYKISITEAMINNKRATPFLVRNDKISAGIDNEKINY